MAGFFVMNDDLWEAGTAYGNVYFSVSFDSGESAARWHRARFEGIPSQGMSGEEGSGNEKREAGSVLFSYIASDSLYPAGVAGPDFNSYLEDENVGSSEKVRYFEQNRAGCAWNPEDILLHGARGRYFWFMLEVLGSGEDYSSGTDLCGGRKYPRLRVDTAGTGILDYLPEWMRDAEDDGFLSRFLSVFQSFFLDMQERINHIGTFLSPESADSEHLQWLGTIAGCPDITMDEETRRLLTAKNVSLCRARGTGRGLLDALDLVFGKGCIILETFRVMARYPASVYEERYASLYGRDPRSFLVLIGEDKLRDEQDLLTAERMIGRFKPADTKEQIVVLSGHILLGGHCYLGMNSAIAGNPELRLDNHAMLPFQTSVAGERNGKGEESFS